MEEATVLAQFVGLTIKPLPQKKAIVDFVDPNYALCRKRLDPMLNHQRAKSRKIKVEKAGWNEVGVP